MNGFRWLLLICLMPSTMVAWHLHRRSVSMKQQCTAMTAGVPQEDPRLKAAELARKVEFAKNQLMHSLIQGNRLLPLKSLDEGNIETGSSTEAARTVAGRELDPAAREEMQLKYNTIMKGILGKEEIAGIQRDFDTLNPPLPRRVSIYFDAIMDWFQLRRRWPEPMGRREIETLGGIVGYRSELVSILNPAIRNHRKVIQNALRLGLVDGADAIDFLGDSEANDDGLSRVDLIVQLYASDQRRRPTYQCVVNLLSEIQNEDQSDSATHPTFNVAVKQRLLNQCLNRERSRERFGLVYLALVSQLSTESIWAKLTTNATGKYVDHESMQRVYSHAVWHQQQIDSLSEKVLNEFRMKNLFDQKLRVVASDSNVVASAVAMDTPMSEAVLLWIDQVQAIPSVDQPAIYRKLIKIAPSDSLRSQVLEFTTNYLPESKTAESLAAALFCRWARSSDVAKLLRHAVVTDRVRASIHDPDATAEAIKTLCRCGTEKNCNRSTVKVAEFWMDQPRWPRSVSNAWIESGSATEDAFCEILLRMNPIDPPKGAPAALQVLASIGGEPTLATLEVLADRHDTVVPNRSTLNRYLKLCRSRVSRRLSRSSEETQK